MENPSGQEKPQLEPSWLRPPGLEMGRGLAICSLVFMVFIFAQISFLVERVLALTPDLHAQGFSLGMLDGERFQERWVELASNGDILAGVSLWSGLAGLAVLMLTVYSWKRAKTRSFLALSLPHWKPFLAWTGLFILVFAALEGIAYFFPEMSSPFMDKVLSSVTNYPMLIIGVGIMPAIFEEFLLRGALFGSLRHVLDKHVTIAIVAGVFTLVHQQYDWYIQLFYVLPLGVFLGYARSNTGSIWTGVFLHMANNCLSILLPHIF